MTSDLPRAASVILLREAAETAGERFEVYMLRRPETTRFAPGAYSFPGGVLETQDGDAATAAIQPIAGGLALAALHARLAAPGPFASPDVAMSAALLVCAARELFEEAGVLVARDGAGRPATLDEQAIWSAARDDVLAGQLAFGDLLARAALALAPDDFIYFSHWVTPERLPIRYDTHFFLAVLPPGQVATHWPGEMAGGEWLTPREGLARHARGALPMVPVQRYHLERFATFATLPALLDHARTKAVPAVMPTMDQQKREVRLPEDVAACW
ncbi:MAG: NUDIX hydrolase [Thermomicrobiales bacterium]